MLLSVLTVFAVNILGSGQHREAFATDEHGITRERRIKAFSPRRREERKVKQEIPTYLLLLSGLRVFAVKFLGFGGFDRKAINHLGGGGH